MRLLVLGGTRFVGRHVVETALARRHRVTVLHRGRSASPFTDVACHVLTDRRTLTPAARATLDQRWDAVVDTSGYDIGDLEETTACLSQSALYVYVSTCGVYRRHTTRGELTEQSATISARTPRPGQVSAARKLHCERYLQAQLHQSGTRLLIARLGFVVGAHDYSERFAYWLERALDGGSVLVPMDPDQPLQVVDARDVATYVLDAIEFGLSGVLNLAGPRATAGTLIDLLQVAGRAMTPCWVSEEFALQSGLTPWTQIPLWLPAASPERALMNVGSTRADAVELHLNYRPLSDTVAAGLQWRAEHRGTSEHWLERNRELHILRDWRA